MSTKGGDFGYFSRPVPEFNNTTGSTSEVRIKLLEGPRNDPDGALFSLADGRREGRVSFFPDRIVIIDQNKAKAVRWMNTTDDFHTYRIAIIGDTLRFFVDGDEVASMALYGSSSDKRILFGDLSNREGENLGAKIDYVAHWIEGALTTEGVAIEPLAKGGEKTGEWTEARWGLTLDTTGTGTDPAGTGYLIEGFDNNKGSTAEVKMRISEAPASGSDGAMFSLIDGKREGKISFYDDHINIRDQNEIKAVHWMDTTDDFHTYRIAIVGDTLKLFVDGDKVASVTLSGSSSDKKILFGDLSASEAENLNAQVEYLAYSIEGAMEPHGESVKPVWQEETEGWTAIREGFTLNTTEKETDPTGTRYPIEGFDNTKGSTAEVKMRILEAPASGSDGAMFSLIDGTREGKISFYTDYINIRDQNEVKAVHWMDTTDDFHTYRITLIKDTLRVFVDGNQVASTTLSGSSSDKKILFGDLSTSDGENLNARVEYLAYSVEGAITPDEH
jgi:outer membrane murein-binding lipoprotein Lpp